MKNLVWGLLREAEQFVHDHKAYKTGKTGFNVKLPNSEVQRNQMICLMPHDELMEKMDLELSFLFKFIVFLSLGIKSSARKFRLLIIC